MNLIKFDKEGFLINGNAWNPCVANEIAKKDDIILTKLHWLVIDFLREYYQNYQLFPLIRQINQYVKKETNDAKIGSIELYKAFPHGVLKQGAKIAGLVKPPNCL